MDGIITRRADRFIRRSFGRGVRPERPEEPREKKRGERVGTILRGLDTRRRQIRKLRRGL